MRGQGETIIRYAVLLAVLLSACAEAPAQRPYGADIEPLDANGLPPKYSFCVRHAAMKTAAIYDAYYPCRRELSSYVARMGGLSMEEKSTLVDDMQKKAMDYAHAQVVERHGAEAVRRTVQPPPAPKVTSAAPSDQMKQWAECSVRALVEAHSWGHEPAAVIAHAKALCHHLWTGSPEAAERLYSRMLASVRAGPVGSSSPPPGEGAPVVIDRQPMAPMEKRF